MIRTIHLSEQQRQAIEAQQGRPIEVVDPVTSRLYFLVAADTYEGVRQVLEGKLGTCQPANAQPAREPVDLGRSAEGLPLRQRVKDLETPPEVAEEIRQYCKKLGLRRRKSRESMEEELKLQYYFGGQYVGYLRTGEGKVVVAAGPLDQAFDRQLELLSPEERRKIVLYAVPRWNDQVSTILSPISHEN